jgi:hypothetical protein
MKPSLQFEEAEWFARCRAHEARVSPWVEPHLARSSLGERHPVYDFLFEYYSYRPGQLRRWHPGIGCALSGPAAEEYLANPYYRRTSAGVEVSILALKPERETFIRWLEQLLVAVMERPPYFGCAGLHEWAMVYRTPDVRHSLLPMRLAPSEIDAIVRDLPIRCTHFDAFRFFTPEARPLNRTHPTRERAVDFEQAGCLHANMDLYKWAYKLAPFTPSELVADAFELAWDIREVDMRASPYDLSAMGFSAIPIETAGGRDEYEQLQRSFSLRAAPIRERLIGVCHILREYIRDRYCK